MLALLLLGWRSRWRDGLLRMVIETYGGKLALEQWETLLKAAKHADGGSARSGLIARAAAAGAAASERGNVVSPGAVDRRVGLGPGYGDDEEEDDDEEEEDEEADVDAAPIGMAPDASMAEDDSSRATVLVLRGMLLAQPASVCLGVLRRQPSLASRLPPSGYVELLHAVRREAAKAAEAPPIPMPVLLVPTVS